jgi:prepilin-type N-terminal cleavage/methylation domain-containing protein
MSKRAVRSAGFSLIELLVSILILGMMLALLVPAVQSSRETARSTLCRNQLHQLGFGLHVYHEANRCFPPGSYVMGSSFPMQSGWGWGAMVLPYVELPAIYKRINFCAPTGDDVNLSLISEPIGLFRCPCETAPERITCMPPAHSPYELASGNYCGSEGVLSAMSQTRIADITDGTSTTLLLGERLTQPGGESLLPFTSAWCGQVAFSDDYDLRSVPYLSPSPDHPINASPSDPLCFGSRHPYGANFALADGSVVYIASSIDSTVFVALGTTSGGEAVYVEAF